MHEKTALIIGASGFVGRAITQHLAASGWRVRAAGRLLAHIEPLRQMGTYVGQVTPVVVDIHNAQALGGVMQGVDAVINCIGILAENSKQKFDVVHGELPGILARAAAAGGVHRFVHISAIGADANSASHYVRSKAQGEGMVRALFPHAVILRPSIIFGVGDSFFNRFARMAQMMPFLPLIAGGHTKFQPVYVGDVAAAVEAALVRADSAGKVYELGGPAVYSFKKLMQILLNSIRRARWLVPVPERIAMLKAALLERLPGQLLTRDQVVSLRTDNVITNGAKTLADLGIQPTALEVILPTYLDQYRPKGRF